MIFNLNKILSLLLISLVLVKKKVILNNSFMYFSIKNFTKYIVTMPFYLLNNDKKYKIYIFLINKHNKYINLENLNIYNIKNNKLNFDLILNSYIFNKKKLKYIDIINSKKIFNNKKKQVIVAIDAGHGGQDPGAVSKKGLKEKNVTIAIARKLKLILDIDPMFKPVLIRDGDYFISVNSRSDVASKKSANVLVSIHADAVIKNNIASGASIFVLSNLRANNEMASLLNHNKKKEELLGYTKADPYIIKAVLDFKFSYSQRVGYDIALKILNKLKNICKIHKIRPEYASLGVLCSPDIPSILVETGFISNTIEEELLSNSTYQDKIVKALYLGLRAYFIENNLININNKICYIFYYVVKKGDTLTSIASSLNTSVKLIYYINKLNNDVIFFGDKLLIP